MWDYADCWFMCYASVRHADEVCIFLFWLQILTRRVSLSFVLCLWLHCHVVVLFHRFLLHIFVYLLLYFHSSFFLLYVFSCLSCEMTNVIFWHICTFIFVCLCNKVYVNLTHKLGLCSTYLWKRVTLLPLVHQYTLCNTRGVITPECCL